MATSLLRGLRCCPSSLVQPSSSLSARWVTQTALRPWHNVSRAIGSQRMLSSLPSTQLTTSTLRSILPRQSLLDGRSFFSQNPIRTRFIQPSFFSTSIPLTSATESAADHGEEAASKETLTPPSVYKWLFGCSLLVFSVVVVGGVTRLTESGLSITEWRPVAGTIPPITRAEWEVEFDKYKATPEYKLLNHGITLEQFKSIFYMEWGHRVLGRLIGLVYVLPMVYFISTRRVPRKLIPTLAGLGLLLGFQGFLGWYMVKSGLEDSIMETPGAVPRVSQYRLAAHLTAALLLYAGMLSTAMSVRTEWRYGNGYGIPGLSTAKPKAFNADALRAFLATKVGRRFKVGAWGLLGLIFTTAISGAFVAGLDAGLLYNEFPLMGGRLAPPSDELFSKAYAKSSDGSDLWWRNIFENPTTVQFDHRCLAITTYFSSLGMFLATKYHAPLRAVMPALTQRAVTAVFHAANLQVLLGISTLLYLVPVPLAAAHQAGSVVLLSCALGLLASLRRPGAVAKAWRQIKVNSLKRTSASGSSTSGSP